MRNIPHDNHRFRGSKFILASQTKIQYYQLEVDRVMEALGHPEALVTDESRVVDFLSDFGSPTVANVTTLAKARQRLECDLTSSDLIWQVAERLRQSGQSKV